MALSRTIVDWSRPPVVRVLLNCAANRNRLDETMIAELGLLLDEAEADPGIRVFVLESTGEEFCAGWDLGGLESGWRARITAVGDLLARLTTSPLITIALVNGAALGGGVGLAAACDQVVTGECATFRMTEVLLGLIPAVVLPVVARRVGGQCAFGLALTARELSGLEAVDIGLADRQGGENGLRRVLLSLRAADPTALVALKQYRSDLSPLTARECQLGMKVLNRQLEGSLVHSRLAYLRAQGFAV